MKEAEETKIVEAKNRFGKRIHISEAESGKKGYFCLACSKEMQAKKGQIKFHHFSHDPKDQAVNGKCTYMNETYRHIVAKEILQRLKFIKVPPVYKFPPREIDGRANKLNDSQIISASRVRNEITFFEDEKGIIRHSAEPIWKESGERHEIIRPDVTFFDANEKPILLIELVATHKLTEEKKERIRHLGIDCVQVLIPKDDPVNIEMVFSQTQNTKWIYNGKEAKTEYVFIPNTSGGGISEIDEQQRDFFEEGFACRQAAVRNLIRSLEKCLRSESYREIESRIRSEISRVEANSEGERQRAVGIQKGIVEEVEREQSVEAERIRLEISRVESATIRERRRTSEIQERIRKEIEGELFPELEGIRERRAKLDAAKENLGGRYIKAKEAVERDEREYRPNCTEEIGRIRGELEELQSRYPQLEANRRRIRDEKARIEHELTISKIEISRIGKQEEDFPGTIERDKKSESERFREEGENLEAEFRRRMQAVRIAMAAGDFREVSKYSTRLKELFDVWGILDNYISKCRDFKRLAKARKCFDGKNWKNWPIQKP